MRFVGRAGCGAVNFVSAGQMLAATLSHQLISIM